MRFRAAPGGQYTPLVYWYRCQDGVPSLPSGTIYGSTIWGNANNYDPGSTPGEFPGFRRQWRRWDRPFDYGHLPCGLPFFRSEVPPYPPGPDRGLTMLDCCKPPGPQPPPSVYPPPSVGCSQVGTVNLIGTPPGGSSPPFTLFYDQTQSSPGLRCVWIGGGFAQFPPVYTRFRLLNVGFAGWVADMSLFYFLGTTPIWFMSIPSYPTGPNPYTWTFVNGWPTFGPFPSGLTVQTM